MSAESLQSLSAVATRVPLHLRETLIEYEEAANFVYFPLSGVVSVVHVTEDGAMVEVAVVGREGLVGIGALLGAQRETHRVVVQGEGAALRVSASKLRELFQRDVGVQSTILTFVNCFLLQIAQTAVCNRLHSIEQRLARWILMINDRSTRPELNVSQEFLAYMIGARRAGINEAVQSLRGAKILDGGRSRISIVDQSALEQRSCGCYSAVRSAYETSALVPTPIAPRFPRQAQ